MNPLGGFTKVMLGLLIVGVLLARVLNGVVVPFWQFSMFCFACFFLTVGLVDLVKYIFWEEK